MIIASRSVESLTVICPPDPSCNAYLAFSAMLLAGLDGVQNRIDPGEPLEKDIYDLSPEELKDVPTLPGSLDDSLKALENDHDFLLKGVELANAFGVFVNQTEPLPTWHYVFTWTKSLCNTASALAPNGNIAS